MSGQIKNYFAFAFETGLRTSELIELRSIPNAPYLWVSETIQGKYEETLDHRALIMVAHSNFQQRIDIISSLCEQLAPEFPHLQKYRQVVTKLKAAQKGRNKYAHSGVLFNEDTKRVEVPRATARGSLKTSIEKVEISDLQRVSASIHETNCALYSLITNKKVRPMWDLDD